jgi:hypothetical protein
MTPKDWTLLVLAAARGQALQPVHLQKGLFLLGRQLGPDRLQCESFYQFEPYDYGPFCSDVYADAEILAAEGLITIHLPANRSYRQYSATDTGLAAAATIREQLDAGVASYLDGLVAWLSRRSFREVVSAVYKAFPEMRANSVFQE